MHALAATEIALLRLSIHWNSDTHAAAVCSAVPKWTLIKPLLDIGRLRAAV